MREIKAARCTSQTRTVTGRLSTLMEVSMSLSIREGCVTYRASKGGWYAMERTDDFVKVWFWSATDTTVPSDVSTGAGSVNTDNWVRVPLDPSTHQIRHF